MRYCAPETGVRDPAIFKTETFLFNSLEPVIQGMGMALIELSVFQRKGSNRKTAPEHGGAARYDREPDSGSVRVRAVIYKDGITGVEDCSRAHRGIIPRLELAFPGKEIYLEVSSPGINRIIKDGREFGHYVGKGVSCFCTDTSEWTAGILAAVDETRVTLRTQNGEINIPYETIAKARLNDAPTP